MINIFDRTYHRIVFFGLIAVVWFATLFKAAHNLWAASVLFLWASFLVFIFCTGRARDKKPINLPLGITLPLILFAFGLSIVQSYDLETTCLEIWGWVFTVLLFYLFVNVVDNDSDRQRFILLSGSVGVPLALICLWQQIVLPPIGYGYLVLPFSWIKPGLVETIRYGHWEIHGTLINSVVLAGFILYWPLFFWKKVTESRRYAVLLWVCLITLLLARSWWAFFCLLLGFVWYDRHQLTKVVQRDKKASTIFLTVLGFCFLFFLYVKIHHRSEGTFYSANSRLYYWATAIRMWRHYPWTGVGLGGFATAFPHFKIGHVENTLFAHSFPLQVLAESGLIGTLAFLALVINFLRLRSRAALSVYDVTLGIIVCFSLLSINMDYLLNKITLFIFMGAALVSKPMKSYSVRPLWLVTGGCSVLLLSPFWLNMFAASRLYNSGLFFEQQGDIARACRVYQDAVDIEPYQADSYWRMSQIYRLKYEKFGRPEDHAISETYRRQAFRIKKDVHFQPSETK